LHEVVTNFIFMVPCIVTLY